MSRIGTIAIDVPDKVTVTIDGRKVTVQGEKGTLEYEHRPEVAVAWEADEKKVRVTRSNDLKQTRAYHGMTRSLIQNMVLGVTQGFRKDLEVNGVGWTARLQGKTLALNVGYADTREVAVPMGVDVEVQGNRIIVTGIDKQAVGQFAAEARSQRPPEPYNGKGIKYADEQITRKEGKAFASG